MSNYRKIVSKILTEANSFWSDSGVVDVTYAPVYNFENGKPVTVEAYHMTPHEFTKFKIGQVNGWGKGVYLTNNPEDCSFNPETIKNWNKMWLYATFFKPFVYEDEIGDEFRNWLWSEIQNVVDEATIRDSEISKYKLESESSYMDTYYRLLFKNSSGESFKKQSSLNVMYTIQHYDEMFGLNVYKQLGLDGMILPFGKTGMADEQNKNTVWYVCYKPNQIKSVETNNGDYNLGSDDINEGVELTERLFPEIPNELYKDLLKDTSENGKANAYTKFFGKYLVNNRFHPDEDIAGLSKRHKKLYQAGLVKPIEDYKDIFELIYDLEGKNDYKTNSEQNKLSKASAKVIGEMDGFKLYQINSYNASKKYGAGTKWCTTSSTTRSHYDNYKTEKNGDSWRKLIYAINADDEKYALTIDYHSISIGVGASVMIYNAEDKCVATYMTSFKKQWDFGNERYFLKEEPLYSAYGIYDDNKEQLLSDLLQWAINKYHLSKEEVQDSYASKLNVKESANDSFYEYSNTDDKAIGICGLNREAARGDSYTMIIDMPPQEFLSLSAEKFEKGSIKWFEEQIKQGVPMAMPFLEIEIENPKKKIARVYGHEGRHRSAAVAELGYTNAQCILFIRDFVRNGYKKEDLIGWTLMGQKSHAGNPNTHENNSFVIK